MPLFGKKTSAPIPGGYKVGDQVVALTTFTFDGFESVSYGDVGAVLLGPGDCGEVGTHVLCKFPNMARVSLRPEEIEKGSAPSAPIPGGYKVGDQVVSLTTYTHATGSVAYGDVGTVLGPGAGATEGKVKCKFPNFASLAKTLDGIEKESDHVAARAAESTAAAAEAWRKQAEQHTQALAEQHARQATAVAAEAEARAEANRRQVEADQAAAAAAAEQAELDSQRAREEHAAQAAAIVAVLADLWTVPAAITKTVANSVQAVVQDLVPAGGIANFWTTTVLSYATGWRPGDADGAGPGMFYATAMIQELARAGYPCFSGLAIPGGVDCKTHIGNVDSFSFCCVAVVVPG